MEVIVASVGYKRYILVSNLGGGGEADIGGGKGGTYG